MRSNRHDVPTGRRAKSDLCSNGRKPLPNCCAISGCPYSPSCLRALKTQGHDARGRRIHSSLPKAHRARWLPPNLPHRLPPPSWHSAAIRWPHRRLRDLTYVLANRTPRPFRVVTPCGQRFAGSGSSALPCASSSNRSASN